MNKTELNKILKKHVKWLADNSKEERANLRYADLRYANLRSANLSYANLRYANLSYADLRSANLRYADLSYADIDALGGWTLLQLLQVNWRDLPDDLTLEMMRWDSVLGPTYLPKKFIDWKKNGNCPFGDENISRSLIFQEKKGIYKRGKPKLSLWELLMALFKEKNIKSDWTERVEE